uniref:Homeobox domain-containing protein n=1 Tax=Haptolina brevifila TaxID=156173 RepID=A0A7S2B6D3_9EUKA|mmetsp:Transcript_10087/g.20527  ORF Transcript_10087/g.20527 Transcript_10087/m.20527 type:complete len:278 (+) Transcript_10087:54-887(+)
MSVGQTPCPVLDDLVSLPAIKEEAPIKRFVHRIDEEAVAARIARSQALLTRRPSTSASPKERSASVLPLPPMLQAPLSDAGNEHQSSFRRPSVDEEQVTPPIGRSHSPDILSVAHILASSSTESRAEPPSLNRSPSIMAAATALMEATARGTRRRLEVLSDSQTECAKRSPKRSRQSATLDGVVQQSSKLWIGAIGKNISIRSNATPHQLKLLSAAFQLCPQPTNEQLLRLSSHVSVTPQQLNAWFQNRRTLQVWAQAKGAHLQPATLARLFYVDAM